ncbi:uncharacterized protein LOC107825810 [Nicotiana tabacum]|uniref:Uncharacterized protein LOC107825810 n=1 Tax=Nicotiana tabacum TaxID=4097 RepID=A0AC58UBD9_TOBAC
MRAHFESQTFCLKQMLEVQDGIVSSYTPQAGLDEEVKRRFWEGVDFNDHIGSTTGGYGEVHGGFDFGDRNGGGTSLLDFAKVFEMVIANSSFSKREEYLVTFQSAVAKTQIDYLLLGRYDRGLCKDCKVIPGESLATQHRLLVMDVSIMIKSKKRSVIGYWSLEEWRGRKRYVDDDGEAAREVLGVLKGFSGGHKGDW